jgi:predicted nuclease of predicted toxin-antitoxin system
VKFKTDENLPNEAAATLREYGFDAQTVWDENLSGATDAVISGCARTESRVLLTLDLDFANIQAYPPDAHAGIIVLRLKRQDKTTVVNYVRRLAEVFNQRSPVSELWIVERDRIRFRQGR